MKNSSKPTKGKPTVKIKITPKPKAPAKKSKYRIV